jgi:hypothetical protein
MHAGTGHEDTRHRLRRRALLADDSDTLELVGHQPKSRCISRHTRFGLVACDGAVEPPDQKIGAPVAVEVSQLGDVLPVGEDRTALDIPQRVGRKDELGRGSLPRSSKRVVSIISDVAVRLFGKQIEIAILVHVGETKPLSHVQFGIARGSEAEPWPPAVCIISLEQCHASGHLLHEQIQVSVAIGIYQLGTRCVEATEKREVEWAAP